MSNKKLNKAKSVKNDEFYTRFEDLKGLETAELAGKKIFLPCDSKDSAFCLKMKELNLDFKNSTRDMLSKESLELAKEADIVITNPPFSILRAIIEVYEENGIKFTLLAPVNFLSTKFFSTII